MSLSDLLSRARPLVEQELAKLTPPYTLFFSVTDATKRAEVIHASGRDISSLWRSLAERLRKKLAKTHMQAYWLRIDWVTRSDAMTWAILKDRFENTKRGYFRYGIALDPECRVAFLEQELNANAMLYGGANIPSPVVNEGRFHAYTEKRFGKNIILDFSDKTPVYRISTEGVFVDSNTPPQLLYGPGRNAGRRIIDDLDAPQTYHLINTSSRYLASQVRSNGMFEYGWHCCFDRAIGTYNTLRHASSTYAMTEAWEVTGDEKLKQAIDRALDYLTGKLIQQVTLQTGDRAAFLVERNGEIKLGGNAVCLLALVKYSEITGTRKYHALLEALATGVQFMQDPESGQFTHVLQFPDLQVKEEFRIIYYDGEATFGLMRLYGLTKDTRWLSMVEKAFDYFIANNHWRAHDHWLSYCVNELTLYRQEERYYQFGIQNVSGHLDFVIERITTFPTLLELMMAAELMVARLRQNQRFAHLLQQLDLPKFYRALHTRAMYLLNGYFWPEYAMYFKNPRKIVGSFYIRHHAFRVRIDDVEHYLSGFVAFRKYLLQGGAPKDIQSQQAESQHQGPTTEETAILAFAGDVNLARRQHYRTKNLGEEKVFGNIPALTRADLSVVNLECVVATSGQQGIQKGERAPFYYRARPEMLRLLCQAGIDVVATANNHSGDYGAQALLEQGFWLDTLGVGHAGSGIDPERALSPVIRAAGPINVAIFSIDATQPTFAAQKGLPGTAYLDIRHPEQWKALLQPRIQLARQKAHTVVVAVHWGNNWAEEPSNAKIEVGHRIIDAGADAVLGTGAHVLQGIEVYRNRPIIHDAGDLLFDTVRHSMKPSGIFRLTLSHLGVENVQFVPVGVGFGYSRQLTGENARSCSELLQTKCQQLGSHLQIQNDGTATLSLSPPKRQQIEVKPAKKTRYNPSCLENIQRPLHPDWSVAKVPEDAQTTPVEFGPLLLLGIRVLTKRIKQRQILWVESFWTLKTPVTEDLRLDICARPAHSADTVAWGEGMDHDPCDWQVPTSQWKKGIIYRDYAGIRPPHPRNLENTNLRVELGLRGESINIPRKPVNSISVEIDIQGHYSPLT